MSMNEAAALVRAARECGLTGDDLSAVERATKNKVDLDGFDPSELSDWQKALTYAVASWLARADGALHGDEHASLEALGDRLDLPKPKRAAAGSAAFDIFCLEGGHKPDKYDFEKLVQKLREKLPSLAK